MNMNASADARAYAKWNTTEQDDQALDDFIAYQRGRNYSPNTIKNRVSILMTLRSRYGTLLGLTTKDLRLHLGRDGVKAGTRRTEHNAMLSFYRFAVAEGYRDDDPTIRLETVVVPKGEPRPFTREQIDAMLASGAYRKTRAMILLGYYQGFRVSQISRVHGTDIDLLAGTIRTISKGKERTLPLHPVIRDLAQTMPRHSWWFPARGTRTGHMHPTSVTDLITRAKKRAGITDPTLTPHSLRHAFGTDLVEEGVDILIVQKLMTHESVATTQIYAGVSARRKREGILSLPVRPIPQQSGRRAA